MPSVPVLCRSTWPMQGVIIRDPPTQKASVIRIFGVSIPAGGVILFCSEVILLVLSFLLAGFIVLEGDVLLYFGYDFGTSQTLTIFVGMLWTAYMLDLYSDVLV